MTLWSQKIVLLMLYYYNCSPKPDFTQTITLTISFETFCLHGPQLWKRDLLLNKHKNLKLKFHYSVLWFVNKYAKETHLDKKSELTIIDRYINAKNFDNATHLLWTMAKFISLSDNAIWMRTFFHIFTNNSLTSDLLYCFFNW